MATQPNLNPVSASQAQTKTADPDIISLPSLDQKVQTSIKAAQDHILGLQIDETYWCGELFVDTTVASDVMIYMHWMDEVDPEMVRKIEKHILDRQLPDGGWNIYPGGPSEINASVKSYFSLKLAGHKAEEPLMKHARANILRLGGIPRCNTYCKFYLAMMGQFPWKHLPLVPAEIILLPDWFFFSIYEMSSWSRGIVIPLAIINHYRPSRVLPPHLHLHELYPMGMEESDLSLRRSKELFSYRNMFLAVDAGIKFFDALPWKPFRKKALQLCEEWMVERVNHADGIGAIFPCIVNSLFAMKALGYGPDHPLMVKTKRDLAKLYVDDRTHNDFRVQPCQSPVWDTAIATIALRESGLPENHPQLQKAVDWMVSKEIRFRGDWVHKNPAPEPSGWAFEFWNDHYPDVDDTAMVMMALSKVKSTKDKDKNESIKRAMRWLMTFQCRDGGWAAFDKDVMKPWLQDVPFADHNAILDPSCSDITARIVEMCGLFHWDANHPQMRRALKYIRDTQEEDGSWYGRWGVNYVYGTWQVLRGLHAMGINMRQDWILRARDWLESCQNEDGGWGESCHTYDDANTRGQGESTASQTAWGLMGVCACGDLERDSIRRAVEYLIRKQEANGEWKEDAITGTGFPKVFYLKYDYYRLSFPLMALATYNKMKRGEM
ncbi:MAG: squalene--hopene cyclase [Verrucomicrobiae bacterium]|nr:squalene--hopene cyclase [Verrucomicrobiae bacterium]